MKKILYILLFLPLMLKAQIDFPIDTTPNYQIMIDNLPLSEIRTVNDTIAYVLVNEGEAVMAKWDDIHQDTITEKYYIMFCDERRTMQLEIITPIESEMIYFYTNWRFYKLGIITLDEMKAVLVEFKLRVLNKDINPFLKMILLNSEIINYKRTKII